MITLLKCRQILGKNCALPDPELESLRDQFYALADVAISTFLTGVYLILLTPFETIFVEDYASLSIVEIAEGDRL